MSKISKKYINEAIRIRESYINTLENILEKEKIVKEYQKNIKSIEKSCTDKINQNPNISVDDGVNVIKEELLEIDKNIKKIEDELNPLIGKIEDLKKDSKQLYNSIKEKYPTMEDVEIQKEIFYSLKR